MDKLTIKERLTLLFLKRKLFKLKFLFRWTYGKSLVTQIADGYRMGEYYFIPRYSKKLPLPPNEVVQPFEKAGGLVEVVVPERDMFVYAGFNKEKTDDIIKEAKKDKKVVYLKEPIISEELKKTIYKESMMRHLHVTTQREIENERRSLEPMLKKLIFVVLILIGVIAFAIVVMSASNAIVKVVGASSSAINSMVETTKQVAVNQSAVIPQTW